MPIVTVAAHKGGVGKTLLAYELAYALGAVLIDVDWDWGGATRMWGYNPERRVRSPLLDALVARRDGSAPAPQRRPGRPALVPSDDRLSELQARIEPERWTSHLTTWAEQWPERFVVVDTHPGENALTDGALAAAHVVVVPLLLGRAELQALEGMLHDRPDFPILIAPNRFRPRAADQPLIERLRTIARHHGVKVARPISDHPWIPRRRMRAALCSLEKPGKQVQAAVAEFKALAQSVREMADG